MLLRLLLVGRGSIWRLGLSERAFWILGEHTCMDVMGW